MTDYDPKSESAGDDGALLAAAIKISGDEARRAFLETACPGDQPRIERLLKRIEALSDIPTDFLKIGAVGTRWLSANDSPESWEPPSAEQVNGMIPGYELTELLGYGGMGAVYRATHLGLDHPRAIKLLRPGLVEGDSTFAERFEREAKVMARLNHPNIVTVYDFGFATGHHYIVMEFVDGTDLQGVIRKGEHDPELAFDAVSQVCAALDYAHRNGYAHRDIKPSNIFLATDGTVKVGDFGLVKLIDPRENTAPDFDHPTLTVSGTVPGTPFYTAPEMRSGVGPVDQRADIYSLGVTFYEMLTGEIPQGRSAPPSTKVGVIPAIDEIVFRAMADVPDSRYQSAAEFRASLEAARKGRKVKAARSAAKRGDTGRRKISVRTASVLLGVLALLFAAGFWWFSDPSSKDPPPPTIPASELAAFGFESLGHRYPTLVEEFEGFDMEEGPRNRGIEEGKMYINNVMGVEFFEMFRYGEGILEVEGRIAAGASASWRVALVSENLNKGILVYIDRNGSIYLGCSPFQKVDRIQPVAIHAVDPRTLDEFHTLSLMVKKRMVRIYFDGEAVGKPLAFDFDMAPGRFDLGGGGLGRVEFERSSYWKAGIPGNVPIPEG